MKGKVNFNGFIFTLYYIILANYNDEIKENNDFDYSLLQFYSNHFINGEEATNRFCIPTKEYIWI